MIEDACQAIGVRYHGRYAGAIGHAGAFSFNQQKNIKSGEGGAVLTSDERIYARAGMYHDVGSYTRSERFETDEPLFVGVNLRMPELSAAILLPQLKRLSAQMRKRAERRRMIVDELSSVPGLRVSPHNDPANAIGVTVTFDSPTEAERFGASGPGIHRLIDTGRHVYTNWASILDRRTYDERFDPYAWAHRPIEQDAGSCPGTLDILARTCSVSVKPEIPVVALKAIIRRSVRSMAG